MPTNPYLVPEGRPFHTGQYWPEGVPHQIEYDYTLTLNDMFENSVKKYLKDPVIWFLDGWITYAELKDSVDRFATALHSFGVSKGDVVAIHLPNSPQYVVAYYAIVQLGAIVTGINPQYKPTEILHQLKITGATYLVVLDALYTNFVAPIMDKWELKKVIHTNMLDMAVGLSGVKKFLAKKLKKVPVTKVIHPNAISFKECLKFERKAPKIAVSASDPAVYMMTGGTTGIPKAAILTHLNCVANSFQSEETLTNQPIPNRKQVLGNKTALIGVLPLYHSFAMTSVMNFGIKAGCWMKLYPKPPPTEELLKDFHEMPDLNGCIYCGAEILFQRIAELPSSVLDQYDIKGKLTLCISGAGPLHEYVRIPYEEKTGSKIREGYGLAEACPIVSTNNFFGKSDPGTIGVPFPGTDWRIFPTDDFDEGPIETIGEEGTGEICICGPQVMNGYLNEPEQTADTIKEWDGRKWLLTGDIGFMDKDGRVVIRDRKKQLIKLAGHSVFPAEVESLLGNHPQVLEAAVAGVPDQKTGEAIKAWVALKPSEIGKLTTDELLSWANENLTRWKVPKYIEIVNELPKSAVGKVIRRTLQEADPLWQAKNQ
ncbi:Acetyl-coenzyme A synthetase [Candidatus Lokiarchaeum ossiferum]|uniref:Long-chain-fatty-acid--CoA ligase n=1 Tax=Candidatus Lokiarchaeum ossiferum TaxID=2951803 RepID=A0ABY6HPM7_9ARCH|nr:Acetyl-coenzyme A synthetase [Candidatus Lokiarchaeum sp. B-35]